MDILSIFGHSNRTGPKLSKRSCKSPIEIRIDNVFFLSKNDILGFKSCGIPPRKILHDNEGGRMEKVRGRTGNGDVHIKPG
jgi:hypothetical protein